MKDKQTFVELFRDAAPYIHSHHDKRFVIQMGGEIIASDNFQHLIHDLALLYSLGIKLVLVFGVRTQIDSLLKERNITPQYCESLRVTDEASISSVKQAVGEVKIQIEALLSMGLPNSAMPKMDIKIASGNYVTGRPYGVVNGVDFKLTGRVRNVENDTINKRLDSNEIVLITPLGYSSTGEIFNLSSIEVAAKVAIGINADKLILLSNNKEFKESDNNIIRQLTCAEAKDMLGSTINNIDETPATALAQGIMACEAGVGRIHYVSNDMDGGLLQELFTRDGFGTLLSSMPFDKVRQASVSDVGGIYELILPLEEQGILIKRSREKIENDIKDYKVLVRDGTVIACAALHNFPDDNMMEIACMAVHPDYQNQMMGEQLYQYLELLAIEKGAEKIIALTTQTSHWFIEKGFAEVDFESLPIKKRDIYDYQRNSIVLIKKIR
ncbi:MAG: amino-acid N-acetyltransferase [Pseudomonadota bacterium]